MKSIYNSTFFITILLTHIASLSAQSQAVSRFPLNTESPSKLVPAKLINYENDNHDFQSARQPGQIDRVKVQLKVGGEILDTVNGKENREEMSIDCNLVYDEKTLSLPAADKETASSIRKYNQAAAELKLGEKKFTPQLRPERALILAEIMPQKLVLCSPNGTLTREELELIDTQGDSLLLDRFLPDRPVAIGDSWEHSEKLMAQFLGLDEVVKTDVQSTLREVTDKVARFELSGKVSGAIDGITSEIEVKGKYRFDLKRKRIDWLGMLLKEKRKSSPVTDGLELTAQIQLIIVPSTKTEGLSEADLKDLPMQANPELLRLSHLSKQGGWEINYDRTWHLYRDQQDAAVLRKVEGGELIAQCNLSSLPQAKPDKLVKLDDFQEDIKRVLGDKFKAFIEARQSLDESNRRVLRVMVSGTDSELPILWNYYHIADQEGHQAGFVFTYEEKYTDRLGKSDRELVDMMRFVESK